MIFKRNLKKTLFFAPKNYPDRCSPRTVCNNLLYTVAIYSTVCNNLLKSEARMATLCNKKNCCYIASLFVLRFVTNCYIPSRCYIPWSIRGVNDLCNVELSPSFISFQASFLFFEDVNINSALLFATYSI